MPTCAPAAPRTCDPAYRMSWSGLPTGSVGWTSAGTGTPRAGAPAPDDHREDPGSDDREHQRRRRRRAGRPGGGAVRHRPAGPPRGHRAAHRRRAHAGRRAGAAAGPRPRRHAGDASPAAHARRLHGQPRAAQGVLPPARPGRHRRPALQHPGYDVPARHLARAPSTRPAPSGSTWRRPSSSPSSTTCRTGGCSGGPSAPTWRSCTGTTRPSRARSCSARRCGSAAPSTCRRGLTAASRSWRWFPSTTTTCAPRRRPGASRAVPQARVVGVEGGRHLWVGETLVRRALDEIVAVVAPDRGPLPRTVPASLVEPGGADAAEAVDPADTDT